MKTFPRIAIILAGLIVAGCVSIPIASSDLDASAKTFSPSDGEANLYIARNVDVIGFLYSPQIVVDGRMIGTITYNTYLLVSIEPGHHTVVATSRWGTTQTTLEADAGKNYFFWFNWHHSWMGLGMTIQQIDEESGKEIVQDGRRVPGTAD